MDGEVHMEGVFTPLENNELFESEAWELAFSDEFNQTDGSQPDNSIWRRSNKASSAWNRFISDSPDVVYLQGGNLVTRCIPDPNRKQGSSDMISGAVETRGKYAFQYGRAEARIKTTKHRGNFPAFWMMPENTTGGWPTCGEIDIFETIDNQDWAWHTVHSHWTYDLKNTNTPVSSANENVNVSDWHVYALEWDAQELRWYIDDTQVFSYRKSSDTEILSQGQWPFDKEFYLILNQSVGNGSWAANPDADFIYETLFDWVRVYQLQPTHVIPTGIENYNLSDMVNTPMGVYSLIGHKVADKPTHGLPQGVYLYKGNKIVIR